MTALMTQMVADTPAILWPLTEAAGTTAVDVSGNAYDGGYVNGPTPGTAGFPTVPLLLDGTNDYVEEPVYHSALNVGTGDFALECWVQLTNGTGNYVQLMGRDVGASGTGPLIYLNTGTGVLRCYAAGGSANGTTRVSDGKLHHVVFRRSTGTCTAWLDGVQELSFAAAGSVDVGANARLRIGTVNGVYLYTAGRVGYAAWYTHTLSDARIAAHYAAGLRAGVVT